jgi:predicted DNA-binding protein (UPF0251 family)
VSEPPITARGRLLSTYRGAARLVEALPSRAAFRAATELAELLRGLAERAADLRAAMAARVRAEEGLSVRALAPVLGVSRSTAWQLVARARAAVSRETPLAPSLGGEGASGAGGALAAAALGGDEGVQVSGGDVAGLAAVLEQVDASHEVGEIHKLGADEAAGGVDLMPEPG